MRGNARENGKLSILARARVAVPRLGFDVREQEHRSTEAKENLLLSIEVLADPGALSL